MVKQENETLIPVVMAVCGVTSAILGLVQTIKNENEKKGEKK